MAATGSSAVIAEQLRQATAYVATGEWPKARSLCIAILSKNPRHADALHLLGAVCSCEGDLKAAKGFLGQAIAMQPRSSHWLRDLAIVHIASGEGSDALDKLSRCLRLNPVDAAALTLKARVLLASGRVKAALQAFERSAKLDPSSARAHLGAADCLHGLGRFEEAAAHARSAMRNDPDSIEGHRFLAAIHTKLHDHDEALVHRLALVRLLPGDPEAVGLSAAAYYQIGETDRAVSCFRHALTGGLSAELHAAFLAVLLHYSGATAGLLVKEHRSWARRHCIAPAAPAAVSRSKSTRRRLRVAYLCAEPADSPVFRFVLPLLRNHDRKRFAIDLYCTEPSVKKYRAHCCPHADEFCDVSGQAPWEIAEQIRRKATDILVDVSGHYGGGSLLVAAMRAAPVQVSYPHYPATTGIPQMDYIFTDRWTCEPGQERQYTERPYRLDSGYLVYDPPRGVRRPARSPAERNGPVTFGIFQRPAKLNSRVWDAVAEILKRVGNSRLLIHHASANLDSAGSDSRRRIEGALESRGVSAKRADFRGIVPFDEHIRLLSTVDIALDSFPYTGQTTTCDCLWMGVPVVTLAGTTHVSRLSAGLLLRMGLGDMVARDVEEYIRIAVRTAESIPALARLRQDLRRRMRRSTLVDGARVTREVEQAYRRMWRESIDPRTAPTISMLPS